MNTSYSAEKSELEKFKKSFVDKAVSLSNELERLLKVEDEIGILVSSRRSLEVIISEICLKELNRPRGSEPLKGIIEKLNKDKKIPSYIFTSMVNLNSLSTYGAHPKTFSPRQVKTVLNELLTVVEWYASWHGIESSRDLGGITENGSRDMSTSEDDENIGKRIGNFKLLESLGEGGMGRVYLAQQNEPVKRRVALKIIKLGMDTKEVVARFRAEQQALAVMDHPNIARVYDAGSTETGRPYFVMELIRGIPITTYCDKHKLTTKERLEIFISICHAVQHAHQKGIIHRDLKPSNILVSEEGDKPVIKIIDFGIAKAIDQRLTSQTLHTRQGQLIGTPEYMSPEQAVKSGLDIDTRADIFSLGVILYELLAGVLPFDPKAFQDTGVEEIQQILTEIDPPRVSTRISKLGDTQTEIAEQRKTDVKTLHNQIKGDLDWITMKAMSKERAQRYSTAIEFAADIERHLRNEPIIACPPSKRYLIKKYIARNKIKVVAVLLVIIAVIVGLAGTTIGMVRAKKAEARAIEEARIADEVSDLLTELFEVSDPNEAKGNTITAREILDKGAARIENELSDEPEIKARMMTTMGNVYFNLGLFNNAEELFSKALKVVRSEYEEGHIFEAYGLINIAKISFQKGLFDDAIAFCDQAEAIIMQNDEADPLEYSRSFLIRGMAFTSLHEYDTARIFFERSISILEESMGPNDVNIAEPHYQLGWLLHLQGKDDDALVHYTKSLEIREKELGEESLEVVLSLDGLGTVYSGLKNFDEANRYYNRALAIAERMLDPYHPFVADIVNNIGVVAWFEKDWDKAKQSWKRTYEIREKVHGLNHPQVASVVYNLGLIEVNLGNYDESIKLCNQAISIYNEVLGPENNNSEGPLFTLAYIFGSQNKYEEAINTYKRVLKIREKTLGPDHPRTASVLQQIGLAYRRLEKFNDSMDNFERAAKIWEVDPGPESFELARCLLDIAILYAYQDNAEEADRKYREANDILKNLSIKEDREIEFSKASYKSLMKEKDEAIKYLKKSLELGFIGKFYEDPRFKFLYGDTEFQQIVNEYKEKYPGR